jgi:hypothetical protein
MARIIHMNESTAVTKVNRKIGLPLQFSANAAIQAQHAGSSILRREVARPRSADASKVQTGRMCTGILRSRLLKLLKACALSMSAR